MGNEVKCIGKINIYAFPDYNYPDLYDIDGDDAIIDYGFMAAAYEDILLNLAGELQAAQFLDFIEKNETGIFYGDGYLVEIFNHTTNPAELHRKEEGKNMSITIIDDPNKKAQDLYYKLHKCLKISLDPNNNPGPNGDDLSCHTNDIITNLAKSIESGETWYDVSVDVWCDYFIKTSERQAAG